jgi:hypothetical protein
MPIMPMCVSFLVHQISASASEVHTYVPEVMPGKVCECMQYGDCASNTGINPALVHYYMHAHTYRTGIVGCMHWL